MDRRTFIAGAVAAFIVTRRLTWAQERMYRLVVAAGNAPEELASDTNNPKFAAFFSELRKLGYIEGQNLQIERWSFAGRLRSEFELLARQIVDTGPDLIFSGSTNTSQAFRAATDLTPIVFNAVDAVGLGLAESLTKPGGNMTGFDFGSGQEIDRKRVEILHDAVPGARRFAYLTVERLAAYHAEVYNGLDKLLGITFVPVVVDEPINEDNLQRVIDELARFGTEALVYARVSGFSGDDAYKLLARLALAARLPAMRGPPRSVELGLLVGYAQDQAATGRGSADYVDKILKGADPAELPVQRPAEFNLPVNLKTARALGIEIPPKLLIQATEIIE